MSKKNSKAKPKEVFYANISVSETSDEDSHLKKRQKIKRKVDGK